MIHAIKRSEPISHKTSAGVQNCILLSLLCSPRHSRTSHLLDFLMISKVSFGEMEEPKLASFQKRCDTALN